ncbi:MAG: hypothetical protein ACT452_08080 [Microthrixaceae bacterium]
MTLNDSDLSDLLAALKAGEMTDTIRTSLEWVIQQLIEAEATAVLVGVMLGAPVLTGFPAAALSLRDQVDLASVLTTYAPDVGWSLVTIAAMCVVLTSTSSWWQRAGAPPVG